MKPVFDFKPVSFLQLIHFNDKVSKLSSPQLKRISNTENLFISKDYHSSYSTDNFNNQTEAMDRLHSTYVRPKIKEIYHPANIQESKLNIDASEHDKI